MKQYKIAAYLNSIDPILLPSQARKNLYLVAIKDSKLEELARKNHPQDKIITISVSNGSAPSATFKDVIIQTDIAEKLKAKKIKYFVLPHKCLKSIELWALKNKIKLIGTPPKMQRLFEDKIFFDGLLKKYKIESPLSYLNINDLGDRPCVVQKAKSFGMFGTQFFSYCNEAKNIFGKNLIREFVDGQSFGISIFVDRVGNYFCSGLRRQCFLYKGIFPKKFLGIQWVPNKVFSSKLRRELSCQVKKIVKMLISENFFGIANIDFIIHAEKIFVLECNPRLSSATQHVFSIPHITTVSSPWDFYLKTFFSKNNPVINNSSLPKSNFSGALVDYDLENAESIRHIPEIGLYEFRGGKIKFIGQSLLDYHKHKRSFFLVHELEKETKKLKARETLFTIISNFALFDGARGELNGDGKHLLEYFCNLICKNINV